MNSIDPKVVYRDLVDVPVLVSGGASGIGRAIVAHFVHQGAHVAFLDTDADGSVAVVESLGQASGSVSFEIVDLRDISATRHSAAALAERVGPFRVLVNNAGDDTRHDLDAVTPEYWDDRFAVNLRPQFFLAQAVAPAMAAAGGGSIINLGSTSWMFGAPGMIAYTTAKSAVEGLTKSLARELGTAKIRVNSVAPGWVLTPKQVDRANATAPHKFAEFLERQAIKEHLEPADIAHMVLWLASSASRRCTGQTFIIDGGVI